MPTSAPMIARCGPELIRRHQPLLDQLAILRRLVRRQPRMRHRETVPAESRHIGGPGGPQPAHHLLQQHVAVCVSQRVVDRLEACQVDGQHGQSLGPPALGLEPLVHRIAQPGPRQRAGQRIVRREERQPLFRPPAFGDIPEIEAGDALAVRPDRARGHRILHHQPVVAIGAVLEHRQRQFGVRYFPAQRPLDRLAHIQRQHRFGAEAFERPVLVEQLRGDAARRRHRAAGIDHHHAGEIVGDRDGKRRGRILAAESPQAGADRPRQNRERHAPPSEPNRSYYAAWPGRKD